LTEISERTSEAEREQQKKMSNFKAAVLPLQLFVFFAALCAVLTNAQERNDCPIRDPDEELPCVGPQWEGCGNLACPAHQENGIQVLRCLNTSSLCDGIVDCPFFLETDEGSNASVIVLNPQLSCRNPPEFLCQSGAVPPIPRTKMCDGFDDWSHVSDV